VADGEPLVLPGQTEDDHFQIAAPVLNTDASLRFFLIDTDGIRSRVPQQINLVARPDETPRVSCVLTGIGTAITPKARLPFRGKVSDDHGIRRAWIEYQIDDGAAAEEPITATPEGLVEDSALDLAPFSLQTGQQVSVGVRAEDNCGLASGFQLGDGQKYTLDVVTEGQLRAMLEARELIYRRQLESIMEQMEQARETLLRFPVVPDQPSVSADGPERSGRQHSKSRMASFVSQGAQGNGDEDLEKPAARPSPEGSSITLSRLRSITQTVRRSAQETGELAQGFADIRTELANNRIEIEDLNRRLYDGIERPLREVAEKSFPPLVELLVELEEKLADPVAGAKSRGQALASMNEILERLRQVSAQMVELESFNELVDMLREIIQAQELVTERTEGRRKQKILELLQE
jgi:hypothetical protein